MTTALIISELLPLHDDALIADIDRVFDEIDRSVEPTPPGETRELLLIVDELVEEMLAPDAEGLEISLTLDQAATKASPAETADAEVAEVA